MRIAIVFTYPIYHASVTITVKQWLKEPDREREIATMITRMGHQVELWAAGEYPESIIQPAGNNKNYTIRIFKTNPKGKRSKYHFSDELVEYARDFAGDFHILKGVDGGIGTLLLHQYLCRGKNIRPFGFIIGGDYYSRYVPTAEVVFYETNAQKQVLQFPGWRFWRKRVPQENLIRLPKWVDTDVFCPQENAVKEWDILVVGRLIPGYKNYEALGLLSRHFHVAVAGDGPGEARLRSLYPGIYWLGHIPNYELPAYFNRARLFMHTSFRDFYPRVIIEALACGVPCIAFAEGITAEVLPPECGILVNRRDFVPPILGLFKDEKRLLRMGLQSREYALKHVGNHACGKAIEKMFHRLEKRPKFQAFPSQSQTDI
jgi:glycosyltransferase involved in cell wall biosynthesis